MSNDYCVLKKLDAEIARHRVQLQILMNHFMDVSREISRLEVLRATREGACSSKPCCPDGNVLGAEVKLELANEH